MSPPRHRPALIVFVIVAALTCLALGWWQWNRFQAAGGTAQNLGYALQWPLFAGFFVYAYRRFVRLESEQREQDEAGDTDSPTAAATPSGPLTEIPSGLLPPRPTGTVERAEDDDELLEYNRYLAELNARDRKTG